MIKHGPLALLLLLAAPGAARAALDYDRYEPASGAFTLEYPKGWRRSLGLGAVRVAPDGQDGETTGVTLERYPLGARSPATAADFEQRLRRDVGRIKRLDAEADVAASGRRARRLAFTVTAQVKSRYGQRQGRRELYLIVPEKGGGYAVLSLVGSGSAFERAQPEFERMARTLKLAPL
jgi:hypothetical protein